MTDKIALFDMDGTIADYDSAMKTSLARLGNEEIPQDLHVDNLPPWLEARMGLIKSQRGWWKSLPVIKSGLNLMQLCADMGFNIHVLTQGPKRSKHAWAEKYEWCEEFVAPICEDYGISVTRSGKGLHYGRVFVDDYPPYMQEWLKHRPRGLGLMPTLETNKSFSYPQVYKYNPSNWKTEELIEKLKLAYDRN